MKIDDITLEKACELLSADALIETTKGEIMFLDGVIRTSNTDKSKFYFLASEHDKTWTYVRRIDKSEIKDISKLIRIKVKH